MTLPEINTVCFVGAGTMGCYNALAAAISGYQVRLYDVDPDTLAGVPQRQTEFAAMLVAGGYCDAQDIAPALERTAIVADLQQACATADLVSESVFERLDIKRDIHRQLDELCPAHTILTTNSSMLLVSAIEDAVDRGDRFAALHSHLGSPLVDIVGGPRTDPAVIDILSRYVLSTRGVPLVLKKEHPGYVLNAMLGPLLSTAMRLLIERVATVEEVDRAWMSHRSAAMGPFGMMDLFGLNLIHDTWRYRPEEPATAGLRRGILDLLAPKLERGELGMKSGKGFYSYPEPRYQQPGFLEATRDSTITYEALVVALVGNAVLVASRGVAEPEDIDRAWMVGTYLDAGPFGILEQLGVAEFLRLFNQQVMAGRFDRASSQTVTDYLRQYSNDEPVLPASGDLV